MVERDIMRINCKFCNADLGIPVENITEEGLWIPCPHCNKGLFIQKSQFEKYFEYSMHCPKCGELQSPSEECIYCNVIINKYLKIKGIKTAWEILSQRFAAKNPASENAGPLNTAQALIIKCPNCGFSKKLSKDQFPSYITRIGCPNCDLSFDIINWMDMEYQNPV